MNELVVKNVSKAYGKKVVLEEINFSIESGMVGLLGNNGAGKTTLMNMITGLVPPDKGEILLNGLDIDSNPMYARKMIGYLPQEFELYNNLTAYEMLEYIARLNKLSKKETIEKIPEILKTVNLFDNKDEKVGGFSGGMKRRMGIGMVLIKNPNVIIVDEPTAGLDPIERVRFRTLLSTLSNEKIVLLSTHIVEDISATCNKLLFIKNKRIRFQGTPDEWLKNTKNKVAEALVLNIKQLKEIDRNLNIISMKKIDGGVLVRFILDKKIEVPLEYKIVDANLEDAFLYYNDKNVN